MSELKKHQKSRKLLKIIAVVGLFFVFVAGIFYGLIFMPLFRIEKVFIDGTGKEFNDEVIEIASQKLGRKIFKKIPVNNQIFLPDKDIASAILNKFPEIKAVNTTFSLKDHSLKINLQMRQSSAIWCRDIRQAVFTMISSSTVETIKSGEPQSLPETQPALPDAENCFFVDSEGFVFKPAPILSGGSAPIVYEHMDRDLNIKEIVSNSKALKFILETKKQLDAANLNLTDFVISNQTPGDLEIISPDGWKIILNLDKSPAVQINALKRVLEKEIKEKRGQLEYVDLRVENRVYYKLKQ